MDRPAPAAETVGAWIRLSDVTNGLSAALGLIWHASDWVNGTTLGCFAGTLVKRILFALLLQQHR